MGSSVLFILLLAILQSFLFYGKGLGLNAFLFIVPLLVFLTVLFRKNNMIKNKWGLLFIFPITILSVSYFIYDFTFIKIFNVPMIILFILLMYIYTVNPVYKISSVFKDSIKLLFGPLSSLSKFFNIVDMRLSNILRISGDKKKKIKAFLIVIPITIIVLLLLSSADMIFNNIFIKFFKLFKNIQIGNIIGRVVVFVIVFMYMGSVINYLLFNYKNNKLYKENKFKVDNFTVGLLLTVLNVIYIVFDFIQIKSLVFHKVAENINYAEYAREGFFQLMFISFINLIVVLISKHVKEENKYNKAMNLSMVFLTFIIIMSSMMRMHMYESVYGYTLLRLLVYVILLTEIVMLIPTIVYIFNSRVKILKYYIIIVTIMYTSLSLIPINRIIAKNNIDLYYKTNKIDIDYLENYDSDNIDLLIDFYNSSNDKKIKENLGEYLVSISFYETNGFQEYNVSKARAKELLKDFKK